MITRNKKFFSHYMEEGALIKLIVKRKTMLILPQTYINQLVFLVLILSPINGYSELKPLDDSTLSEVTGQAFVAVDQNSYDNISYTTITMGMDIETQLNVDTVELGNYEREGEAAGSSDILINNLSLGYIYDDSYYQLNSKAVQPIKDDGSSYSNGEIVPFNITDPYIEFATDDTSGDIIGVRLGFGEAQGVLSGDILSLTGNINVEILDTGEGLSSASSSGNLADELIVLLTPLLEGDSALSTTAQLVNSDGELDPIRASLVGVPNGDTFVLNEASGFTRWSLNLIGDLSTSNITLPGCSFFSCPGGDIVIETQDCSVLGVDACYDLSSYNSLPIGEVTETNGNRYLTDSSEGLFLSFQTQDMPWLNSPTSDSATADNFIQTRSGAFLNIPNEAITVNLGDAMNGIDRVKTEYIDRGIGLF